MKTSRDEESGDGQSEDPKEIMARRTAMKKEVGELQKEIENKQTKKGFELH